MAKVGSHQKTHSEVSICSFCSNTGWEYVVGRGVRPCPAGCLDFIQQAQWCAAAMQPDSIPREYRHLSLYKMVARVSDSDPHGKQAVALDAMRADRGKSFLLYGPAEAGKTALAYAAIRDGMESMQPTYHGLLGDVLDSMKEAEFDARIKPLVPLDVVRRDHPRVTVFLDDFDKARINTEYRQETLQKLIDAIYRNHHRLIITMQCTPEQLEAKMASDVSLEYAEAISRRIQKLNGMIPINFFKPSATKAGGQ